MRKIQVTLHPDNRRLGKITSFTGEKADKYVNRLRQHFRVINPAKFHVKGHRKALIPTYLYCIGENGLFRVGLLAEIYNFIVEDCVDLEFEVSEEFRRIYEPSFPLPEQYRIHDFSDWGFDSYRDVQTEAIKRIFRRGRGVVEVGTAGGKGLIMAAVIKTILDYNPTFTFIVIVPTHLVAKTVVEFRDEYGITDITGWGGGLKPDFTRRVLVAGPHTLGSQADKHEQDIDRNVCLIDECHIINHSSKIANIVEQYVNTPNIVGFTGSLSNKEMDRWRCIGTIGKLMYTVPSSELKEKGFKSYSRVVAIKFDNQHYRPEFPTPDPELDQPSLYIQEQDYLLKSDKRNRNIARFIKGFCPKNTLVPIELDSHQITLVPILEEETGRPVWVIDGKVPPDERLRMYAEMENVDDVILVVKTGCMKEGISIKNLHYLAMVLIKKSFIRLVQLIGRAERLNDGKDEAIIMDFYDDTTYSARHYGERKEIYESEGIPVLEKSVDYHDLKA